MKAIFIISGLFIACIAHAQVYKYKAFTTYFSVYDDNGNYLRRDDSITVDFLVVLNMDKRKITTYGKKEGNVDLVSEVTSKDDKRGNTWLQYDGIDDFGEKCIVQIEIFKDQSTGHKCNLFFDYPKMNEAMVFYLKKDD